MPDDIPENEQRLSPAEREKRLGEDLRRTAFILVYAFVLGWLAIFLRSILESIGSHMAAFFFEKMFVSFIWSLAWLAAGFFFGFIFGVPKVQTASAPSTVTQTSTLQVYTSRFKVNTNLEEISDWLTKVLVGATLTQITKIPGTIKRAADYMSLQDPGATQFDCAILLYYTALGFLAGYIITRLFFARAFARVD